MINSKIKIVVISNFLATEIRDSLSIWFGNLSMEAEVIFGAYDSVIQQLLDPRGVVTDADFTVILLQVERWCGDRQRVEMGIANRNISSFLGAARFAASTLPAQPFLIVSCPVLHSELRPDIELLEEQMDKGLGGLPNVSFVTSVDLAVTYPAELGQTLFVEDAGDRVEMQYSQLCFAIIGTQIARSIHMRFKESRKVIVVDCDNTLWSGACGEGGPLGVEIGEGNRLLQQILARQSSRGQLVCLCSKNNERDVFEVFERHRGMVLKLDDVTAHRINWNSKTDNLRSLSEQLCLGLDSFLFLDDDTFECESVRSSLPEVKTIQVSGDQLQFSRVVSQIWDFDRLPKTKEDEMRGLYYKQSAARDIAQRAAGSLREFLESLDLRVDIRPMQDEDADRVSQLLRRITQFNLNGILRSARDLKARGAETPCYTIRAADRFGDYGLVGVIVSRASDGVLLVESMALSCRALGRGVEPRLVTHLAETARFLGCEQIAFDLRLTPRNSPFLGFLNRLSATNDGQGRHVVSVRTVLKSIELI
jgi:FkbH-like protein